MSNKVREESDFKSNLVTEICSISSFSNACVHTRQRHCPPKSPPFIDWYRLLGVEEDAGIDVIRKRYHKLALQLHPDKNKHPKADIAFKLVSEAHALLSDDAKRRAFDLERWRNFCFRCNAVPRSPNSPKQKPWSAPPSRSKSHRFVRGLKDIRDRFREETKVIEKCMRAPMRKESPPSRPLYGPPDCLLRSNSVRPSRHKESPVFNPTDYAFDGYPHVRSRIQKKPADNFWYLQAEQVLNFDRGIRRKCDSPIFEARSDSRDAFKSKSACVHS